MKKNVFVILIFLCAIACVGAAAAQEGTAESSTGIQPFTIIISGTRSYADIDSVRKGVQKIPTIQRFVETVSSQNHMQFTGVFTGDASALIASIEGAASDRFDVQSKDDKTRGLVITLRKASKQAP